MVLISGTGSNLQALAQAAARGAGQIAAVICNRPQAPGVQWAREQGLTVEILPHQGYTSREDYDAALVGLIDRHQPDYVLLAGFMRILTPGFVARYEGRLVNIHPSLLPMFPGLHTHRQALADGVRLHGCTVHFVTAQLDHGPIIAQGWVPVLPGDTEADLAARVLEIEHRIYPEAMRWLAQGRVTIGQDGRVDVAGQPARLFSAAG